MSQRDSGYERKERDLYETPAWVTEALLPHIPEGMRVWEPAAGGRKMSDVLSDAGHEVTATDISDASPVDFLGAQGHYDAWDAIITNPPYENAQEFIQRALLQAQRVAMLLRTDFDHAKTRQHLFGACAAFAKKIVLTKRIRWFEESTGSPSFNHAWYIWERSHGGPPQLFYGPRSVD